MSLTHALSLPKNSELPRMALVWQIDSDHVLHIGIDRREPGGRISYTYQLLHVGRTIFGGRDFCTGFSAEPIAETLTHAATSLLGFLTLRPGDVEADYFEGYTSEQIAWRDEFAEHLSIYTQDHCCGYCGGDHDSPACVDR
jgi:hypothetical protein